LQVVAIPPLRPILLHVQLVGYDRGPACSGRRELSDRALQIKTFGNVASLPGENRQHVLSLDIGIVLKKLLQASSAENVIEQNFGMYAGSLETNRPPSVSGVLTRTFSNCFGITHTLYADARFRRAFRIGGRTAERAEAGFWVTATVASKPPRLEEITLLNTLATPPEKTYFSLTDKHLIAYVPERSTACQPVTHVYRPNRNFVSKDGCIETGYWNLPTQRAVKSITAEQK
jgi:hypothetical protein